METIAGRFWPCLACLLLAAGLTGCVSRARAQAEAQAAFIRGQQHALLALQQRGASTPVVNVIGPVQNPTVPWREDLTLAQLILEAGYQPKTDPRSIIIHRGGAVLPVDPRSLLQGADPPLEAGDLIVIEP